MRSRWATVLAILSIFCIGGCSGDEPTAPEISDRPAIPVLAAGAASDGGFTVGGGQASAQCQCGLWSCSIQDCQQDPGQYGACCTMCAESPGEVQPKPSCTAPPPTTYCSLYPGRCDNGSECGLAADYCYNAYATRSPSQGPSACYDRMAADSVYAASINYNCAGMTWDDYPDCFCS